VEDFLPPTLRAEAIGLMNEVYQDFVNKPEINPEPIRDLASRLVNEIILTRKNLFQFVDLRTPGNYLTAHVVNVTVLAVLIGLKMEYTATKLQELAIGTLLMDIGAMLAPAAILQKNSKLTDDEMAQVRRHPEAGMEGIRDKLGSLPAVVRQVAYQHHESFDGKGYPRGFRGEAIHEYARIAGVADMLDALVSDRPFRHYYLPHEAVAILNALSSRLLDPMIVRALITRAAPYPLGTLVQVDSGEIGEVESVNPDNPSRPMIRLRMDPWAHRIKDKDSMDLGRTQSRKIVKVFKDQEIVDWVRS
jgi:HD-GYP domain-containing protein (c-di-GMP phosphodiesterase class II)